MKPIPLNRDTEAVARRVVWFEEPDEALSDPVRFMAYAMATATHDDMRALRRYVSDDDFREGARQSAARYHRSTLVVLLELEDGPLSASASAKAHLGLSRIRDIRSDRWLDRCAYRDSQKQPNRAKTSHGKNRSPLHQFCGNEGGRIPLLARPPRA
jgi:hypothetical protein